MYADIGLFIGRFHPLIVHLPIGIFLFVGLLELLARKQKLDLHLAIEYGLLFGAISAILACALGLLLAADGGYQEANLSVHRWTGIATAVLGSMAYVLKKRFDPSPVYPASLVGLVVFISVAGHYGGMLTHGSTYLLENAPAPLQQLAGMEPPRERVTAMEEALAYEDAIQHIFDEKCVACHSQDKSKGELIMINQATLLAGGEHGEVVVAGNASGSEVYRRVTLDPNHDKFMPAEGRTPMTKAEVQLLEWWIDQGAPFETKIVDLERSEPIDGYLKEIGIGAKAEFLAELNVALPTDTELAALTSAGFSTRSLVAGKGLLDVVAWGVEGLDLQVLLPVQEQVVWLSLSGTTLKAEDFQVIGQLPNLVRLKLDQTNLTDEGLSQIGGLQHLEYLNIYDTQISDEAVETLLQLEGLKKLFVWQTSLSEQALARLREANPELEIVAGRAMNEISLVAD